MQCSANIEILGEGAVIIIILAVIDDPTVDCLYLFGIGVTASTNFVSKIFRLCVSQSCATVGEIRGIRFTDEIVCCDPRDQNKTCYYTNANFRQ